MIKPKEYLKEYWKFIVLTLVIFVVTATSFYFIGNINDNTIIEEIYYQNWHFLQDNAYENIEEPVFFLCANFSDDIKGKSVQSQILYGNYSKYYSFNISATEGSLFNSTVGIFFNDAYAIQLWIGHRDGDPQPIDKVKIDLQSTTLYKSDFVSGVFIHTSLNGSSLEEYRKVTFYIDNIYYMKQSIYDFENFYHEEFSNNTGNVYITIKDITDGVFYHKPEKVQILYSLNNTEEITVEMQLEKEINQTTWFYKINLPYVLEGEYYVSFRFISIYNFDNFKYPITKIVFMNIPIPPPSL